MQKVLPLLIVTVLLASLIVPTAHGAAAQKVTLTLREFSYSPEKVTLQAGVPAEITLVNKGKVPHEFMMYDMPMQMGSMKGHEWAEKANYFRKLDVKVVGGEVKRKGDAVFEVVVAPGKSATVQFTPVKKGTFEIACQIAGHYEAGQKATITVR